MRPPPDLALYLLILRTHRRFIATLIAASTLTAVASTYVFSEKYYAQAKVLVRPRDEATLATRASESFGYPTAVNIPIQTIAQTHEEILRSPLLLGWIVDRLHLDAPAPAPEGPRLVVWLKQARAAAKRWLSQAVAVLEYGRLLPESPREQAIASLAKALKARPTAETYVMEIGSEATEPALAAEIANTAAELLHDLSRDLSSRSERDFRVTMEHQLVEADAQVAAARTALASFKDRSGIVVLQEEAVIGLQSQAKMEQELRDLESKRAGLGLLYTETHPQIAALDSQIALVRRKLDRELQPKLRGLPRDEAELSRLSLALETAEARYRQLAAQVEQARIAEANQQSHIQIVSQAEAPTAPVRPIKVLYAAVAALLATVVAVAWALVADFLWEPVYTTEQIEAVLAVPTLAELPPLGAA